MITLFLGGARSGKSELAERYARRRGGPVTYLATGEASDPDMAARIAKHRSRRPAHWSTVECGAELVAALGDARGTVLVDALGTWLAQLEDFEVEAETFCRMLRGRPEPTILVSDEVGMGVHPATARGRDFRDALGALNREVSAVADEVFLVVAGRTLALASVDDRA